MMWVWLVILRQDTEHTFNQYHVFKNELKADMFAALARDNNWRVSIIKLNYEDDNI